MGAANFCVAGCDGHVYFCRDFRCNAAAILVALRSWIRTRRDRSTGAVQMMCGSEFPFLENDSCVAFVL